MKKFLFVLSAMILIPFAYWTISPLFRDEEVHEASPVTPTQVVQDSDAAMEGTAIQEVTEPVVLASGIFEGRGVHNATGTAALLSVDGQTIVRFEEDFSVTNGPDLNVYLGKDGTYDPHARLAALKGNIGAQNYEIPEGINVNDYSEVWVWCRAFSVPFAVATFEKASM